MMSESSNLHMKILSAPMNIFYVGIPINHSKRRRLETDCLDIDKEESVVRL